MWEPLKSRKCAFWRSCTIFAWHSESSFKGAATIHLFLNLSRAFICTADIQWMLIKWMINVYIPTHALVIRSEGINIGILLESFSVSGQHIKHSARLQPVSFHSNFMVSEITKTIEKSILSCTKRNFYHTSTTDTSDCIMERCLRRTKTWLCHNLHLTT